MDKRIEIAIVYNPSGNWIGGVYYIHNLLSAVNRLPDTEKPVVNVYCKNRNDFQELSQATGYPYLKYVESRLERNVVEKVFSRIKLILSPIRAKACNALKIGSSNLLAYPIMDSKDVRPDNKILGWIPDFQERYYPSFFSNRGLLMRKYQHMRFYKNGIPIVFSSHDAKDDFKRFYPEAKVKTHVLHFAVTLPDFSGESIEKLKNKFGIKENYFFCANQFWVHKNHLFLFKAFHKYIEEGNKDMQLVCSGAFSDYRNKEYSKTLKSFIHEHELEGKIKILGFIKRTEQLCLMKNAYAIIQPSLFEGWSTVVEDAKALNKFIFLSDLKVHREQNPLNVCYFNPKDEMDLVKKLSTIKPTNDKENYDDYIRDFGNEFIRIVNQRNN